MVGNNALRESAKKRPCGAFSCTPGGEIPMQGAENRAHARQIVIISWQKIACRCRELSKKATAQNPNETQPARRVHGEVLLLGRYCYIMQASRTNEKTPAVNPVIAVTGACVSSWLLIHLCELNTLART